MQIIHAAAAVVIDADGRVLVQKRPEGTFMAGYWEFPGGKIESGETPEIAVRREVYEEVGIRLECMSPFSFLSETRPEHHIVVLVYKCREWEGIPQAKNNQEMKWLWPKDLAKLENMLPSNNDLVTLIRDSF